MYACVFVSAAGVLAGCCRSVGGCGSCVFACVFVSAAGEYSGCRRNVGVV